MGVGSRYEFGFFDVWLICAYGVVFALDWFQHRRKRRLWEGASRSGVTYKQALRILRTHGYDLNTIPVGTLCNDDRSILRNLNIQPVNTSLVVSLWVVMMMTPLVWVGLMLWFSNNP